MRSETQPYSNVLQYRCIALRMRFFSQNFGTIKRILPGSSSPSHREGPGTEVEITLAVIVRIVQRAWHKRSIFAR